MHSTTSLTATITNTWMILKLLTLFLANEVYINLPTLFLAIMSE